MTVPLWEIVLERDEIAELDPAARRLALRSLASEIVPEDELAEVVAGLAEAIDGYGPLHDVMTDDAITDVLVNGPREVWVERAGRMEPAGVSFSDHGELRTFIDRLVGDAGGRIDGMCPVGDVRLRDGARLHVVLPPIAPQGPLVSIRKFPRDRFSLADLVDSGMMSEEQGTRLGTWVRARKSIVISGATGSGKTTLLNALLGEIDGGERIVTIEETAELCAASTQVVSLVARPANVEGRGTVGLTTLVRAALRMRPDRIIVGEVRGPEALDALAALATGHEGSMVTVHARGAVDALDRIVALALQAGTRASEASLRHQARRSFDAAVHLTRDDQGRRTVAEILEIE